MAVPSQGVNDTLSPLGCLRLASLANEASATLTVLQSGAKPDTQSLTSLAVVLPGLMSAESLGDVNPDYVDTVSLVAVGTAIRQTGLAPGEHCSLDDFVAILRDVHDDLLQVATSSSLANDRLAELEAFCSGLADALLEQVQMPNLAGDAQRV